MNKTHKEKMNLASEAINAVFGDRAVSKEQTRDSLEVLLWQIKELIEAL